MTVQPSESNTTSYEYSTLEDSMWHILPFEIVQKKGSVFVVAFDRLLSCLPTGLTLIFIIPPGSIYFSLKISCWHPYTIEI